MNLNRTGALAVSFAALSFLWAPSAEADSNSPTTISSEDGALTRSALPVSVSSEMPSGPPALSSAGAPNTPMSSAPRVAPPLQTTPAPAAVPQSPAAAAPVVIMDSRDGEGTVISGVGKRKIAVPGGGVIVDRNGRRLEVVPAGEIPAPVAPKIAPTPAPALPPAAPAPAEPAAKVAAPVTRSSRTVGWPLVLGLSAAAAALGLALR